MPTFSAWTTALGRVTGRRAGQNRFVRATYAGVSAVVHSVTRVVHILWLQVTGLFFVMFGLIFGAGAWREYLKVKAGQTTMRPVYLFAAVALLFLWFGVSSFWRAGRRARAR